MSSSSLSLPPKKSAKLVKLEQKLADLEDEGYRCLVTPISKLRRKVTDYCDENKITLAVFRDERVRKSNKSFNKFMTYNYKNMQAYQMNETYEAVITFFARTAWDKKLAPLRQKLAELRAKEMGEPTPGTSSLPSVEPTRELTGEPSDLASVDPAAQPTMEENKTSNIAELKEEGETGVKRKCATSYDDDEEEHEERDSSNKKQRQEECGGIS
jgi:hypothetical protein